MDTDEKLDQAKVMKDKGTEKFKVAKYSSALNYYKKVIDYLQSEDSLEGDQKQNRDALLLAG